MASTTDTESSKPCPEFVGAVIDRESPIKRQCKMQDRPSMDEQSRLENNNGVEEKKEQQPEPSALALLAATDRWDIDALPILGNALTLPFGQTKPCRMPMNRSANALLNKPWLAPLAATWKPWTALGISRNSAKSSI